MYAIPRHTPHQKHAAVNGRMPYQTMTRIAARAAGDPGADGLPIMTVNPHAYRKVINQTSPDVNRSTPRS
jgi:hypothetical protein